MTPTAIAQRYASALVDVVVGDHAQKPEDALAALRTFRDLVHGSTDLKNALESPAVSLGRKRALIDNLVGRLGTPRTVRNFLLVLSDKRRLPLLNEVTEQFDILLDERLGFVRAEVQSAAELSQAEKDQIAQELTRVAAKQIRTRYSVDPELIGGVVARVGSTVYDGSVRGQLAGLRRRLG